MPTYQSKLMTKILRQAVESYINYHSIPEENDDTLCPENYDPKHGKSDDNIIDAEFSVKENN